MSSVRIKRVHVYDSYVVKKEYHLDYEPGKFPQWFMDSAIEVEQCLVDEEIDAPEDPIVEVAFECPICGKELLTMDLSAYCTECATTTRFCYKGFSCDNCPGRLECVADSGVEGGFPKIIRGPASMFLHKG